LPALDLGQLRRLRTLDSLDEKRMVNEVRRTLFDVSAPTPSIETLLHAFLPHRFVDHSHADAILALTNQPNGEELIRKAVDRPIAILPYVKPGFDLSKAAADLFDRTPSVEGIVLMFHGLVTFGDDARTSYERHIAIVDACERFIRERLDSKRLVIPIPDSIGEKSRTNSPVLHATTQRGRPAARASQLAPILRGLLSRPDTQADHAHFRPMLEWRGGDQILALIARPEVERLVSRGPLTADHLIHTRPWYLYGHVQPSDGEVAMRRRLEGMIATFRGRYAAYLRAHGADPERIDTGPRVVLIPEVGLFAWGSSKRRAAMIADIAEHTLVTQLHAEAVGTYTALPDRDLFEMEFFALEQAKLGSSRPRPIENQVVVISGGAGAIGSAVAEVCAEAGGYVAVTDVEESRARQTAERVEATTEKGRAIGLRMDVTDDESVKGALSSIARHFGGIDVVVPNAGIAHVAPIDELTTNEFRRVMEVNTIGYLRLLREGGRILKEQGLGGNIVVVSSKNVFAPGAQFGAYSASKAAGHQLGRVAALELAPYGVRVNMINPDAIFGDDKTPSGLWAAVGAQRAKSKGIPKEELAEYYRNRNLLRAEVTGRHVGHAVVFFASNAIPTTGASLPIDGGLPEAFPR